MALLGAAIKTGLLTSLAKTPMGPHALAQTLGLDTRATSVVIEALRALGYLEPDTTSDATASGPGDERCRLTGVALARFGDPHAPGYLGWAVLHSRRLMERWLTLPEVLETGQPVPGDRFSETVEGFIRAMDVYAGATAEQVAEICLKKAPGTKTALDIGGATGTVSKALASRDVSPTLFDLPEAIEVIREETARSFPLISLAGGDFNEALPEGAFDLVFLGNITHIYGPDKIRALFERVAGVLNPGGLIAILDFVRGRSESAPLFGINMLVNTTGGGTWTENEYAAWLNGAGFVDLEVLDLASRDQQLILGALPL